MWLALSSKRCAPTIRVWSCPIDPSCASRRAWSTVGAIATLIDVCVVPALAGIYDEVPVLLTIDMQIRFLSAAKETDLIGEGWVTRRADRWRSAGRGPPRE